MQNDSRPVDLLSDSRGVYGIGIVNDDILRKKSGWYKKRLIFRPDILRESTDFPSKYREAVLQTLGNCRFIRNCYEWTLHEVMLHEALKRNPRYQELEEEQESWIWSEERKLYLKIKWGQHK